MNGDLSGRSSPAAASAGASHLRRGGGRTRLPAILRPSEDVGADRVPGIDGSAHGSDENLWRRHLYMGVGSFVFGGSLLLVYIILTFHQPHCVIMMAIDVAAIVGSLVIVGPVGARLLTTRWRVPSSSAGRSAPWPSSPFPSCSTAALQVLWRACSSSRSSSAVFSITCVP